MSGRYTRLANPTSTIHDPDRELEDAFELDDEPEEDAPLVQTHSPATANEVHQPRATHARIPSSGPPAYDFERQDYDFPPPGSPPPPSDRALPNNFGNSNGQLPESPVYPRPSASGSQSLLRRTFGALFPSKYQRLPNGDASGSGNGGVVIGGGTENDGVFANVSAKPQAARTERAEDGSMYVVPEDTQKELPPVSIALIHLLDSGLLLYFRHTQRPKQIPCLPTGRRQSTHLRRSTPTTPTQT
jgi:hypothetical protein